MDIFDLYGARPGMIFGLKTREDADPNKCRKSFKRLDGKQIQLFTMLSDQPEIPDVHVFYFKVLPNFDAKTFIRKMHDKTAAVTCIIPTGAYFVKTSLFVIQHRYASTMADDTNQGYAHVLEILDPPKNSIPFVLHGFEHGKGHQVYECSCFEHVINLYNKMLRFGFPALKDHPDVLRSYKIQNGQPWFYTD